MYRQTVAGTEAVWVVLGRVCLCYGANCCV